MVTTPIIRARLRNFVFGIYLYLFWTGGLRLFLPHVNRSNYVRNVSEMCVL